MKQLVTLTAIFMFYCLYCTAQNIGVGTIYPHPSAQLDISSSSKGILIPRLSTEQRISIPFPSEGLMVYDADMNSFWYFDGSGWKELIPQTQHYPAAQKTVPGGNAGDRFGYSVASGGYYIAIGAPNRNASQGSVFYGSQQLGNVCMLEEFAGIGYVAGDQFGYSVAVDKETGGNDFIGGAPYDNNSFNKQGSVTVYDHMRNGRKIYSPAPQLNEYFGTAVDITGQSYFNDQYIIVGAPGKNSGAGGAYIFWYNGISFVLMQTINPVATNPADSFGRAVSIFYNRNNGEGWAFVGSPNDDVFATDDGSISVYKRNISTGSWDYQFRMTSPAPVTGGNFGASVAANMGCSSGVVIGEPGYFTAGHLNRGRVYYSFFSSNIFQNPTLVATGPYSNNYLGCSVAIASNQACNRSYLVAGSKRGTLNTANSNWGISRFFMLVNNSGSWIDRGQTFDADGSLGWLFGFSVGVNKEGHVISGSPEAYVGNNAAQGKVQVESFPSW